MHEQILLGDPKRLRPSNRFPTLVQPGGLLETWESLSPIKREDHVVLRSEVPGHSREFFIVRWRWLCLNPDLRIQRQISNKVYLHEMFMPEQPVRIFMDIEHEGPLAQPARQHEGRERVTGIVRYVHQSLIDFMGGDLCDFDLGKDNTTHPFLGHKSEVPTRPMDYWSVQAAINRRYLSPPAVMQCNRKGKISYHVVWNVVVADIHALKIIMETILEKEGPGRDFLFSDFVDIGVYRKHGSLRTPGSHKGATRPFEYVVHDLRLGLPDFRNEKQFYVTAGGYNRAYTFPPGSPYFRELHRLRSRDTTHVHWQEDTANLQGDRGVLCLLKQTLEEIYPGLHDGYKRTTHAQKYPNRQPGSGFTLNPVRRTGSRYQAGYTVASFGIRPALPCRRKGRPHKNNGMYANVVRREGRQAGHYIYVAEFICADPECETACTLAMQLDNEAPVQEFVPLLDEWGLMKLSVV